MLVDEDQIAQLRKLDRKATLAFAFSHRSYLDGMLLPEAIVANRLSPALTFGGANLNFFPMGGFGQTHGTIFIRRQTKDIPVYRFALRAYAAQLVQNHANLTWSIEGGGPGPASCDLRCSGSCATSPTPSTKSTVPKCIWCRPPSCTTSCTRWKP